MKDLIVLLVCFTVLLGSIAISTVSVNAVFNASERSASLACGYEAAMGELNRRDHKHSLKLGFIK